MRAMQGRPPGIRPLGSSSGRPTPGLMQTTSAGGSFQRPPGRPPATILPAEDVSKTDEIKAKLRAWHSRVRTGRQADVRPVTLPPPVLSHRAAEERRRGTPVATAAVGASSISGHKQQTVADVSLELTSNSDAPRPVGQALTTTPVPSTTSKPDALVSAETTKHGSDTTGKQPDFSGPLTLSEILKRKKGATTTMKRAANAKVDLTIGKSHVPPPQAKHTPAVANPVVNPLVSTDPPTLPSCDTTNAHEIANNIVKTDSSPLEPFVELALTESATTSNALVVKTPTAVPLLTRPLSLEREVGAVSSTTTPGTLTHQHQQSSLEAVEADSLQKKISAASKRPRVEPPTLSDSNNKIPKLDSASGGSVASRVIPDLSTESSQMMSDDTKANIESLISNYLPSVPDSSVSAPHLQTLFFNCIDGLLSDCHQILGPESSIETRFEATSKLLESASRSLQRCVLELFPTPNESDGIVAEAESHLTSLKSTQGSGLNPNDDLLLQLALLKRYRHDLETVLGTCVSESQKV